MPLHDQAVYREHVLVAAPRCVPLHEADSQSTLFQGPVLAVSRSAPPVQHMVTTVDSVTNPIRVACRCRRPSAVVASPLGGVPVRGSAGPWLGAPSAPTAQRRTVCTDSSGYPFS